MSVSAGKLAKWFSIAVSLALGCTLASVASARRAQSPSSATQSTTRTSQKKHHRRRRYSRRQPFQKAPTPERISEIQSALARNGYYHGDPNGRWDSSTVAAMHRFQTDHGLDSTGKIDALTLQKLGLGSDIAGVSAPKPLLPASSPAPSAVPSKQPPPKDSDAAPGGTQSASAGASAASAASSKPQQQE